MNKDHVHHLDHLDSQVRELQGFLRGLLLDGEVSRSEVRALQDWMHRHESELESQHPFSEILPYLRMVLADPHLGPAGLRDELTWMWERLRTIHLRHPSPASDITVFVGLVRGALADHTLHPSEVDHLLRWLERCPGGHCEDIADENPYLHIRHVLLHFTSWSDTDSAQAQMRQYLFYLAELLA